MVLFWGLDFGHGDRSEGAWGGSRAKSILLRFQGFMQLTDALGKRVQRTLRAVLACLFKVRQRPESGLHEEQ
jgi:hypothetical protein